MTTGTPSGFPPKAPVPSGPEPNWQPPQPRGKVHAGWVIALVAAVIIVPVVLCAVLAVAIGSFAAFWSTHQVSSTSTSSETFAVSGVPTITIHDPVGNVSIVTGATDKVVIQATKRASDVSQDQARHVLSTMAVTSAQTGNTVTIDGKIDTTHPSTQQHIDLVVTVPPHSTLDATASVGTLTISGVSGVIRGTASVGDAVLRNVTVSGRSNISVSVGNLRYEGALDDGATFDVAVGTGSANILLPPESATYVEARVTVGTITVRGWPATVNRNETGATTSVYLKAAPHNTLNAKVGTGNFTLGPR